MSDKIINFADLFAGLGGFREGFETATNELGIKTKCVLTAEIKKAAKEVYKKRYKQDSVEDKDFKDIRELSNKDIKKLEIDVLLGGFVCKSFSKSGNRKGFECDINGDLFFQILKVLKASNTGVVILENVDNLVIHDKSISKHKIYKNNEEIEIGNTFKIVLEELEKLNYEISWEVLNAKDFGLPQSRNRIFIVAVKKDIEKNEKFKTVNKKISMKYKKKTKLFKEIKEEATEEIIKNDFTKKLCEKYDMKFLEGKKINDKRGKDNNIHSWDFGLFGEVSEAEKKILVEIMENRRKKIYRDKYGLSNDGVPLKIEDIEELTNMAKKELKKNINSLLKKGYLKERKIKEHIGYDIISGRLKYYFNNFIHPEGITLTLTATDAKKNGVCEKNGVRHLTNGELCDLFGFNKKLMLPALEGINKNQIFDLFGNSLAVPIVYEITKELFKKISIDH